MQAKGGNRWVVQQGGGEQLVQTSNVHPCTPCLPQPTPTCDKTPANNHHHHCCCCLPPPLTLPAHLVSGGECAPLPPAAQSLLSAGGFPLLPRLWDRELGTRTSKNQAELRERVRQAAIQYVYEQELQVGLVWVWVLGCGWWVGWGVFGGGGGANAVGHEG